MMSFEFFRQVTRLLSLLPTSRVFLTCMCSCACVAHETLNYAHMLCLFASLPATLFSLVPPTLPHLPPTLLSLLPITLPPSLPLLSSTPFLPPSHSRPPLPFPLPHTCPGRRKAS